VDGRGEPVPGAEVVATSSLKALLGELKCMKHAPIMLVSCSCGENGLRALPGLEAAVAVKVFARGTTDAQGAVLLSLPREAEALAGWRGGRLPDVVLVGAAFSLMRPLQPMGADPGLELTLSNPVTVSGRVLFEHRPIAGVKVEQRMVPCAAEAVTDATGGFT